MVNGDIPFETDSQIKRAAISFRPELQLSKECKDLVRRCLDIDVSSRICLADIKRHPWLSAERIAEKPLQNVTPAPVVVQQPMPQQQQTQEQQVEESRPTPPQLVRMLSQPVDVPGATGEDKAKEADESFSVESGFGDDSSLSATSSAMPSPLMSSKSGANAASSSAAAKPKSLESAFGDDEMMYSPSKSGKNSTTSSSSSGGDRMDDDDEDFGMALKEDDEMNGLMIAAGGAAPMSL